MRKPGTKLIDIRTHTGDTYMECIWSQEYRQTKEPETYGR